MFGVTEAKGKATEGGRSHLPRFKFAGSLRFFPGGSKEGQLKIMLFSFYNTFDGVMTRILV